MWIVSKDGLYLTPGKNWTSDRNCAAIYNEPGNPTIPIPLEPGVILSRVTMRDIMNSKTGRRHVHLIVGTRLVRGATVRTWWNCIDRTWTMDKLIATPFPRATTDTTTDISLHAFLPGPGDNDWEFMPEVGGTGYPAEQFKPETPSSRACVTPVIDYDWLTASMKKRYRVGLAGPDGELVIGVINGIRAEDGSGKCWLVTLLTDSGEKEVFTRST